SGHPDTLRRPTGPEARSHDRPRARVVPGARRPRVPPGPAGWHPRRPAAFMADGPAAVAGRDPGGPPSGSALRSSPRRSSSAFPVVLHPGRRERAGRCRAGALAPLGVQDDRLNSPGEELVDRLDLLKASRTKVTRHDVLWATVAPTRPEDATD